MDIQDMIDNVQTDRIHEWVTKNQDSSLMDTQSLNDYMLYAASKGFTLLVSMFSILGADIHTQDDIILLYAIQAGSLELLEHLLYHGADPNTQNGLVVARAIQDGNIRILNKLVEYKAEIKLNEIITGLIYQSPEVMQWMADLIDAQLWEFNSLLRRVIENHGSLSIFEKVRSMYNQEVDLSVYDTARMYQRNDILDVLQTDPRIRGDSSLVIVPPDDSLQVVEPIHESKLPTFDYDFGDGPISNLLY